MSSDLAPGSTGADDLTPGSATGDALLAALPEAVIAVRQGAIVFANERANAMLGEVVGASVTDRLPGWAEGMATLETVLPLDAAMPRLPVQVSVRLAETADGPVLVAVVRDARDLQALRDAEVARMAAEARYQGLIEQIPAVVYADEGGEETTYVSPQIREILGVTPEAYRDDPELWMRMVHPDDRAHVQAQSDAFIAGEGGDLDDYRMVRPDGRIVWIRDRAYAVRDDDGRVLWEHGILFDVTELKQAEERIAFMAFHDTLTGLANRALFEETLGLAIGRAKRAALWVAVLFLDLDNFKQVNDTQGHHAGDELLRQLADRLRESTRGTDLVARQGGDEFLLLLSDLEADEAIGAAAGVAERVEVSMADPFELADGSVHAHGSIGISLYPRDATGAAELLQHADAAMYRAKREARGRHMFWE
jgi:diguanylate cyclase (GGDEF)-like protein/PAS domain S-box-containing protein